MATAELYIPSDSTASGDKGLHARLHIPAGARKTPTGELGVFVICHGLLDTKYAPLFQGLQKMLPFASIAFDFRGNGHSSGETNYGNYSEEADDIKQVVDYVNSQKMEAKVQGSPGKLRVVGIVGHSKGGSSMFLFAHKYQHICPPLLINISARFWLDQEIPNRWKPHHLESLKDHGKFLWRSYGGAPLSGNGGATSDDGYLQLASVDSVPRREYWVTAEHLHARNTTEMSTVQALPFTRCHVLNIMGSKDRVVPERDVWEYDRLMRLGAPDAHRVTTQVVPGASHFWSKPEELRAVDETINSWLKLTLPIARL
ncbi:alpha/beta-hydrolase [Martensiomyces pterosporus]|nr:alpha/beta-hydrolase [Martensiomyces pterosporus]KAI8319119.1 alpha/beta-hydrolase [Martensiomyces pterosporus]